MCLNIYLKTTVKELSHLFFCYRVKCKYKWSEYLSVKYKQNKYLVENDNARHPYADALVTINSN